MYNVTDFPRFEKAFDVKVWTRVGGDGAVWKRFHDRFLSYGGPPVLLVGVQTIGAQRRLYSGSVGAVLVGAGIESLLFVSIPASTMI